MKTKLLMLASLLLLIIIISKGCYYDNVEHLYPSMPAPCDTTNVTYSKSIVGTLSKYCYNCHGASYQKDGKGIRLNSYDDVSAKLQTIIYSIKHVASAKPMPKNFSGMLSTCDINLFVIWKNAGKPNN